MKQIKEWDYIQELYEIIDDLSPSQQEMVRSWFENIDPNEPFLSQQSEKQLNWLMWMWDKFVNGDDESAREWYDD